ncbi:MAG TPA: hypothetical protein PK228_05455 [Saprospiraceae bacterium]|nr:hypothetical protein [Saprospiraceae bacterium]
MNILEMKGIILDKIAQLTELNDPKTLQEVIDFLDTMLILPDTESDGWNDLPPEAQHELLQAIKRSDNDDQDNWISHEEVKKQARSWLQKQR